MFLKNLQLFDFRNYKQKTLEFSEKNVVFYGKNGRGKTNILEAISLLSVGKSWREKSSSDLIFCDEKIAESAKIESQILFEKNSYPDFFKVVIEPRSRNFFKNDKHISLKSHFGSVPTILFCPEYLTLFSGNKYERQKFFDRFLVQIYPTYKDNLLKAIKAHQNKTKILKSEFFTEKEISPWNQILAQTIPQIIKKRKNFLEKINPILRQELKKISQKNDPIEVQLQLSENFEPTEDGVLDFFKKNFLREKLAKKNFISPQRDDFVFFLREKNLTSVASRGEERSVLLSLLSVQKKILQQEKNVLPILLLDDVFSELDEDRQKYLENLCEENQTFFTTTHVDHFRFFKNVQKIVIIW